MPLATASPGERMETRRPRTSIVPLWISSAPKIARAVSVRPEPISPAMPRISPSRSSKLTSRTSLPAFSLSTRRTTGASGATLQRVFGCS